MITFIAPAHKEEYSMYTFIGCLLAQTNKNWKCIIYHNGSSEEEYYEFYHRCHQIISYEYGIEDKIKLLSSPTNTGLWGCLNRQDALMNHVETSHIIQTSIQDYFVPTTVEELSKHLDKDFIYWNSINHIFGYGAVLNCEPVIGRIDWGNFALRTSIAQQVGINHPNEFCADGFFVRDCVKSNLIETKVKLPLILTIHN